MSHCDPRDENNVTVYNNNERCLENISDDNASSCVRKVIWKTITDNCLVFKTRRGTLYDRLRQVKTGL